MLRCIPGLIAIILFSCSGPKQETGGLLYRLSTSPVSLDPAVATDAASNAIIQEIFDGLVGLDPQSGRVVAGLAEKWEISANGRVFAFDLRSGAKFHNGRIVTAQDVRYSFERILDPKTRCPRTWVLEPIEGSKDFMAGANPHLAGIEVLDSTRLLIRTSEPFVPFLSHLAMEIASIVPREEIEKLGEGFGRNPVGTGPFRMERFIPDVEIVLSRFAEHFGTISGLERIRYLVVPNDVVAYEQYKSGGLEFLSPLPTGQVEQARQAMPGEFHSWPILELRYLGFNMEKELLRDHPGLRQAASLAIDRAGIARIIYEDVVRPACGILPPGLEAAIEDTTCIAMDTARAKALLASEGFPNGAGLPELVLLYNSRDIESRLWQFVKANLEAVGFRIQLKSLEWGSYLEAVRRGECDLFRGSWVADYPDPHNFLYVLFHSGNAGAAGNYSRYSNPDYDQLVEKAKGAVEDSVRVALYQQAEAMIKRDLPVCPLFFGGDAILVKSKYEGFTPSIQGVWATQLNQLSAKAQ